MMSPRYSRYSEAWSSKSMAGDGVRAYRYLGGIGHLGQSTSATAESIAQVGAQTTIGILASLHAVIGGVALAGPVGVAIAGVIAVAGMIASRFHGCGQTCIQASNIANKVEDALKQNLDTYMAAPIHHASLQAAALNNVDVALNALNQACSNPQLGKAGQRCISERLVRGGTAPWCPKPGHTGCDWFVLYRDAIANDPHVVPDPVAVDQMVAAGGGGGSAGAGTGSGGGAGGAGVSPISGKVLLIGALVAGALYFGSKN